MAKVTCGHTDRKNFSKGNCKQCAQIIYAKRSASRAKKTTPLKKHVRQVNKETELTRSLRAIYAILSAELKSLHTKCEGYGKISGCTNRNIQIHHKKGRRGFLL